MSTKKLMFIEALLYFLGDDVRPCEQKLKKKENFTSINIYK